MVDDDDEVRHELDVRAGLGLDASEDQLNQLVSISRARELAPGDVLFTRGQVVAKLYRMISGEIELTAPPLPDWRVSDRGAIGFLDYMLARPHARTATVRRTARVLEMDAADYRNYLEDNFDVSHRIMEQLARLVVADVLASPEPEAILELVAERSTRSFAQVEVPVVERVIMLSRMPVFRGASMQAIADLAQRATEARYEPGAVIAARGARPTAISVLVEGAVDLELPRGTRVRRCGRGMVAHADELVVAPRTFAVTAATATVVLQLDREELLDRMEEHFELANSLFAYLAAERDRLNHANAGNGAWETTGGAI